MALPTTVVRGRQAAAVRWLPLTLGCGLFVHVVIAFVCASTPDGHLGDFHRYWALASAPGRPYTDFAVEYPPGALTVFEAIIRVARSRQLFDAALLGLNVLADLTIVAMLASVWGLEAATCFTLISIPILSLLYFRMDLWSTAAATAAVALWFRQRPFSGAAALWAGAALKLWPIPFVALFAAAARRGRLGPLAAVAIGGALSAAAWIWMSGTSGVMQVLTFRGASGWDIESGMGSVLHAMTASPLRLESGAVRVGWNHPAISVALFLISAPVALWAIYVGASVGRLGTGWVAGIGAMLSCSALLSPQFLGWLLPGAAIAWAEDDRETTAWVAALVAVTIIYRVLHTQTVPGLVLVRNVMLIVTTVQAFTTLRSR